jgi:hypothetical protein
MAAPRASATPEEISRDIAERDLTVCAGAIGQPQLRGRVHPEVKMNYLASPPLGVATRWRDAWKSTSRGSRCRATCDRPTSGRRSARLPTRSSTRSSPTCSARATARCSPATTTGTAGDPGRRPLCLGSGSTHVKRPPYFEGMDADPGEGVDRITGARWVGAEACRQLRALRLNRAARCKGRRPRGSTQPAPPKRPVSPLVVARTDSGSTMRTTESRWLLPSSLLLLLNFRAIAGRCSAQVPGAAALWPPTHLMSTAVR